MMRPADAHTKRRDSTDGYGFAVYHRYRTAHADAKSRFGGYIPGAQFLLMRVHGVTTQAKHRFLKIRL